MARGFSWFAIVRLGLVQASIGAVVVFVTSTLNRIMVVELSLPAILPGALVALHYVVQLLRPRWGHGSDRSARRTPWVLGGMALLAGGAVLASLATAWMPEAPGAGVCLAVVGYAMIGVGVGAAGTSLLALLAKDVSERRRAAAATIVWMMMIVGFIVTAGVAGHMLEPFSPSRLVTTALTISGGALLVSALALWRVEPKRPLASTEMRDDGPASRPAFRLALREVWADAAARNFTLFIFLSMLAYAAQDLIVEPFVGTVMGFTPAESSRFAGLQHSGVLVGMLLVAVLGSAVGGRRLGAMRLWTTAGCVASAAAVLCLATAGLLGNLLILRGCVMALGAANGIFSIAAVGAMMQLAGAGAPGREGVRMGLWGAAQAIAFATGGLLGNVVSDLGRHIFGSPAPAYAAVFVGEALLFCLAALLAARTFPRTAPYRARGASAASDEPRWAI